MKIYLDNCALGRLFDEQTQPRVIAETIAMTEVLRRIRIGFDIWFGSQILRQEIERMPDPVRRLLSSRLLAESEMPQLLEETVRSKAALFIAFGVRGLDAQHLAAATIAEAEVLLTTDDRFLRAGNRAKAENPLLPLLLNPVDFLRRQTS